MNEALKKSIIMHKYAKFIHYSVQISPEVNQALTQKLMNIALNVMRRNYDRSAEKKD